MYSTVLTWLALLGASQAQQVGTYVSEVHPSLLWQKCTKSSGCTTVSGSIVLDANWRWIHKANSYSNCYTGNQWDASVCPDPATCANNCALDGADYSGTYGVVTKGNAITLRFTNRGVTNAVGSRVYLLADNSTYEMFKLQNREIAFDVDVSNLPCGLNGALFFTGMDADGGVSKYPSNKAGANYGTGYCDAQCPRDLHFINGEANVMNWTPSPFYPGDGTGLYGSCCSEMDVWEANYISNAYTAHPCTVSSPTRCSGSQCTSAGYCDPEGCDFNPYRMGNKVFYGKGYTIDTTQKITVVTQFLTSDGTATGALSEIRRLYIQNGVIIQNVKTNIPGMAGYDSITEPFCTAQKAAFGNPDYFADKGGMKSMTKASEKGMVLAMSISDDPQTGMLWLDGNYPVDADPSKPGVGRGTCPTYSTGPVPLPIESPLPSVTFSNIRFGELNSTYNGTRFGTPAYTLSGTAHHAQFTQNSWASWL